MIATEGRPEPIGPSLDAAGMNIAVISDRATAVAVSLFDDQDREYARVRLPGRTGPVFHGHVAGLRAGTRYGLRVSGPWAPAAGDRFNPAKLLLDPWATRIDRPFRLHPSLFDGDAPNPADTAPFMPKAIMEDAPPPLSPPGFSWSDPVILELHVRGFTMRHPDVPAGARGTFAALAHPAVIAHLSRLGVTAVELMPTAAWIDERHLPPLGLTNYWGYNPVALLAPDPRLAPGGWAEVRAAVEALRAAGIATILDVVFNHTGEGDHLGPTLSLRGIDNALYYRLLPDDPSRYVNDTGCGHTLALDRPAVWRLALDAMRTWTLRGGVDGFRLDLATTLGRRDTGFDPAAPLLAAIDADPVLRGRAIIAEPWDIGPGGYQLGAFPGGWGEWNDRYRDRVRRFWRGGETLGALATVIAGSADIFAARHRPISRSINFVTAHDGFTLADLVAYERKHNATNGEANRDGTDANLSWNNGAEGPSDDPVIRQSRRRDARALLATLLLSRGTPMLSMGDEAGRTQAGNNNAYAQDNETTWFDWAGMDAALVDFTARLIAVRRARPALFGPGALRGAPLDASGIPDAAWRRPDGGAMTDEDWHQPDRRTLILALFTGDTRAVLILHAGPEPAAIALPPPRDGQRWRTTIDSAAPAAPALATDRVEAAPRSVLLLLEEPHPEPRRLTGVDDEAVDRLARAAGIAPVWWGLDGQSHPVSPETKRSVLTAMRLPADTTTDLAASERRLAEATHLRPLPAAWVVRLGEPIRLPLGPFVRPAWLTLCQEDGETTRIPITGRDAVLPPLPLGRHRVMLEDDAAALCHLAIVPPRCFLPPGLAEGRRRFGIAAHLYALRHEGDQGIGDFTTLARLATAAGPRGAGVIGLNPLHALFPGDRSRASPYHPSHRAFLDPIYVDVGGPGASVEAAVAYDAVWARKRAALQEAFEAGDPALDAFIAAGGPMLRDFARFEAIAEAQGNTDWRAWPDGLRHPADTGVEAFAQRHARRVRLSCFQQMIADRQLAAAAAAAHAAGVSPGLYRDLAIGGAPDGAEAWARQDTLMPGLSIGAPPDPFAANGQVWGLPPPDPLAMTREGYAGFSALLAANMRHAGALRIDHVLGLRRLFVVPEGARGADGTYIDYPMHDLLGHLALESERAHCMVIGEDLGTVPDGMREALTDQRVLSYRVLWFERDGPRFRPTATWPALAAACVSTHDLPTLAGWWEGADIAERLSLGLLDEERAAAARAARVQEKADLLDWLRTEGCLASTPAAEAPLDPALAAAIHAAIAATPSLIALAQADDLAGERVAVNLPGTDRERPNWRRRLPVTVEDLFRGPLAGAVIAAFRASGRG
jgi:glycogen operon protein